MDDLLAWQGIVVLLVGAVLVVVLSRQLRLMLQARAALARDDAYRDLAAQSAAAQRQHAAEVAALTAEVAEVKRALSSVERMMREVG